MAVAGAGAPYHYRPHGHVAGVCRSMAFPAPRGGAGSSLPAENNRPYSSGSTASSFSPAFAAAASGVLRQELDVLDYLSDDGRGGPALAPTVPETFRAPPLPPRMPAEAAPVVPDAGYGAHPRREATSAAAAGNKIAFRTRSEEEVLDDGYKWRKYGKKSVKNSPSPRNYYRCSTEGCSVKKRVERDKDDVNYVVTMYEGVHNHASPGTVYYASRDPTTGRFFVAGMHSQGPG
ncbi:hypothetical protein QYE76_054916 [Lolium multiflorum]|uniref:WRKY domain-containing protein n=1 Tax=Lolium multiflorum TaxID=4521 RepID=A0AAD8WLB3_LOLMU|nr:hypothetical protein QYE76_054916 [Lolium multiflorum]